MNDQGDSSLAASANEPTNDSEPPERLSIVVVNQAGNWSAFGDPERAIAESANALAAHARCRRARGAEASVVLSDDSLVRNLNNTYRGQDKPTNVLSFPFQVPPGAPVQSEILGDIVLAAETVTREAATRAIDPTHHLQHLVVHGLLHLLGFEHETEVEAEDMESLETEILATLGVADPYTSAEVE
jgi:probable rRNA maturation factor